MWPLRSLSVKKKSINQLIDAWTSSHSIIPLTVSLLPEYVISECCRFVTIFECLVFLAYTFSSLESSQALQLTLLLGKKRHCPWLRVFYLTHCKNCSLGFSWCNSWLLNTHKERFAFSTVATVTCRVVKITIIIFPSTCPKKMPHPRSTSVKLHLRVGTEVDADIKIVFCHFFYLNMHAKAIVGLPKILFT